MERCLIQRYFYYRESTNTRSVGGSVDIQKHVISLFSTYSQAMVGPTTRFTSYQVAPSAKTNWS